MGGDQVGQLPALCRSICIPLVHLLLLLLPLYAGQHKDILVLRVLFSSGPWEDAFCAGALAGHALDEKFQFDCMFSLSVVKSFLGCRQDSLLAWTLAGHALETDLHNFFETFFLQSRSFPSIPLPTFWHYTSSAHDLSLTSTVAAFPLWYPV